MLAPLSSQQLESDPPSRREITNESASAYKALACDQRAGLGTVKRIAAVAAFREQGCSRSARYAE
jgi:hypothetical protein